MIRHIEIRQLEVPVREPFVAAHGTTTSREIVVVRIDTDDGHGWGECSALPDPTYSAEFAAGAFLILDEELAPRLLGYDLGPEQVTARLSMVAGNPMAKAALEMALLDASLRADDRSLAEFLGAEASHVPAGAAVGLAPLDTLLTRVESLAEAGYRRVKAKVMPGHDVAVVAALLDRFDQLEVQVDANGSFGSAHLELVGELASIGITALEQPFAARQLDLAVKLVERCRVPVVADEAAESLDAVDRLRLANALSAVSVKPARLGGVLAARAMHDKCRNADLPLTAGGMLETGLGRHALAALAALPGFTITGDVSPAARWLTDDPWPDLDMAGGLITVPTRPGIAGDPDPARLDAVTVKQGQAGRRRGN